MAIQEKLNSEQQIAYEAFKSAMQSLRATSNSLSTIEDELGVDIRITDLLDVFDPTDESVNAFLELVKEIRKEG